MQKGFKKQTVLLKEMEDIERAIVAHNIEAERLRSKLYELLVKKEDLEMQEVIDYAIEAGITSEEMMGFVANASKEKENNYRNGVCQ